MNSEISIANQMHELGAVLEWLTTFVEDAELPDELSGEMYLVAEEVLSNTITHGYDDDAEHRIELGAAFSEGTFSMTFRDDARPFDPTATPEPDLDAPVEKRPVGGLGVHLARTLADRFTYRRDGESNVLVVEKTIA